MTFLLFSLCFQNASTYQSSSQRQCGEIVNSTEFFKANNSIDRDSIVKHNNGGQHLDLKFLDEKGRFLCIKFDESGLQMLLYDSLQMHVYDLTSFKVFVEEMAHAVLCLGHSWEELLLDDFCVIAVT